MKRPNNALNVVRMNVRDGGRQPCMRDTVWHGEIQQMVTTDGVQKEMRTVLEERDVDNRGMNTKKMRAIYDIYLSDFQDHTMILEEEVYGWDTSVYLPKFHCKLSPIEPGYHSKKYTRGHCTVTITRLRRIVPESLSLLTKDSIGHFFWTNAETMTLRAHLTSVDEAVKVYSPTGE